MLVTIRASIAELSLTDSFELVNAINDTQCRIHYWQKLSNPKLHRESSSGWKLIFDTHSLNSQRCHPVQQALAFSTNQLANITDVNS